MPSDDTENLAQILRRLDPKVWERINDVLDARTGTLKSLAELGGLDPRRDFRGISLSGLSLAGQNLRGFDFTGSDLRGCEIRNAQFDASTNFDKANLDPSDQVAVAASKVSTDSQRERQKMPNQDRAQREQGDVFQRLALSALIRFDLIMRQRKGAPTNYGELGISAGLGTLVHTTDQKTLKREVGSIVGDFLNAAALKGFQELKQYYGELLQESPRSFNIRPPHIEAAIEMLYGPGTLPAPQPMTGEHPPQPETLQQDEENEYALRDVFSKVRYKESRLRERLGQNYAGLWDVIRYSAHTLVDHTQQPLNDPWVIRAALQIGPIDRALGRMEPWFEILYRPRGEPYRRSTGSVILINQAHHFALIGREHDVDAPIYVVAEALNVRQEHFRGLVVRRHSTGRFFTSRCVFVRSKAKTMEELAPKIDVYRESELRQKFSDDIAELDRCLEEAVNFIPNDGRGVLLLR